jgi:hypothetical protein
MADGEQPGIGSAYSGADGQSKTAGNGDESKKPDSATIDTPLQIGGKDPAGRTIDNIYWSTRKFAVYQADGLVRYMLPDDYATAQKLRRNIFPLTDLRSNVERVA